MEKSYLPSSERLMVIGRRLEMRSRFESGLSVGSSEGIVAGNLLGIKGGVTEVEEMKTTKLKKELPGESTPSTLISKKKFRFSDERHLQDASH
jgi:hypothetical protein